jgi:hypothetical protein
MVLSPATCSIGIAGKRTNAAYAPTHVVGDNTNKRHQVAGNNSLQRRSLPEHVQGLGTVSYPYTFLYDIAHNKLDVAPKHLHINA